MPNALSRLSNNLFGSREEPIRPTPELLGSGMARNAANSLLAQQYRTQATEAQAMGEEFPTFEEWLLQRRQS